jgi:cytochrome c oxidase subunit 2
MRTAHRRLIGSLAAFVLALACGACGGRQNMLAPGGPAARSIAQLGWFVLIVFAAVTVVMWILIFWIAGRRQGSFSEHEPWDAGGGINWLVIGGFTIPAIILAVMFVYSENTMSAFPMGDGEMNPTAPMIRVIGHQWWWEVHYLVGGLDEHVTTANEIHMPAGQKVDIELRSRDVIHSFWIPELHGKVDLIPGLVNRIRLQSDRPQTYRGECAEYCGPQHAHMILYLSADTPQDFQQWLERERQPAHPPVGADAVRGQELFMGAACVLCHTIRGTDAHGLVGPDLTHVGSRHWIAGNQLVNDTANLAAWVTHAQSLKPFSQMPNVTAFTGDELRDVVTYLKQLK